MPRARRGLTASCSHGDLCTGRRAFRLRGPCSSRPCSPEPHTCAGTDGIGCIYVTRWSMEQGSRHVHYCGFALTKHVTLQMTWLKKLAHSKQQQGSKQQPYHVQKHTWQYSSVQHWTGQEIMKRPSAHETGTGHVYGSLADVPLPRHVCAVAVQDDVEPVEV